MNLQKQSPLVRAEASRITWRGDTHPEIHTTVSMTALGSFPQRKFYPGVTGAGGGGGKHGVCLGRYVWNKHMGWKQVSGLCEEMGLQGGPIE